jgi:hypothetical protein
VAETLQAGSPMGEIEGLLLEYGRQCIVYGVQDEAALTLAGRDTDSERYAKYRPSQGPKDRARVHVMERIGSLLSVQAAKGE